MKVWDIICISIASIVVGIGIAGGISFVILTFMGFFDPLIIG